MLDLAGESHGMDQRSGPYLMLMEETLRADVTDDSSQTNWVWLEEEEFSPETLGLLKILVLRLRYEPMRRE